MKLNKKQKKWLTRIIVAAVLFVLLEILVHVGMFEGSRWWIGFLFALVPYLIVGYDVILKSIHNISRGDVFDENFLMMIATFGAFGIREYPEAVAVMLLYQIGELFQNYATGKSRDSISDLMSIAPDTACVERDGETEEVDPDEVEPGEIIVIRPGERIPLDGEVLEGDSLIDTSALTGEPVPRRASCGDMVISGCVNGQGLLRVRTTKAYEESTVARILEMVESATEKKTRVENFVTRFAHVYTPIVTIGALILALIPPIILGGGSEVWFSWIRRACIFLVVSCPCALVISVPLGFFGGIGAASRIGVLVKGSNYLEALSKVRTIVFDKTGTLTKGEFCVSRLLPAHQAVKREGADPVGDEALRDAENRLLELAACAEYYSTHPIAESIREAYEKAVASSVSDAAADSTENRDTVPRRGIDASRIGDTEEIPGHGLRTMADGHEILAGNAKLMALYGIEVKEPETGGTVVHIACDGVYAGTIIISDTVKEGAVQAVRDMKAAGIRKTVMLTGDRREAAEEVAREIGIDEVHAQLLPGDKVERIEKLMQSESGSGTLAFVGDGINDAPVLMRSDVGIAMGSLGSDAAIEAADIVLMDDDITKIARTVKIAGKTLGIIHTNIIFAIAVKIVILVLSIFGIANMWMAIFGDVGVLILCILNAMRLLRRDRSA